MRAVTMQDAKLTVAMIPDPVPGPGEVLVDVLACGISGTDLHCAAHAPELDAATKGAAGIELMDLSRPIVFGHEFVGRVVSYGPGAENRIPIGRRVCRHAACQDPSPTTGSQYRSPRCASTTTSADKLEEIRDLADQGLLEARGLRAGPSSNSDDAFTASATRPEIEPIACVVRFDQVPIR